jgi:isopentenyl-diphosphate delta-isomerase
MHNHEKETAADEIFDIFNELNEKIGTAKRKDVHREGYYHRSVHVFIINSKKQILMQKRVAHKDIAPNAWDLSVAEHLKPGETFRDAAVRGLQEEMNICLPPDKFVRIREAMLYKYTYSSKNIKDFEFNECWKVHYDGPFKIDPEEVAEAKWVTLDELMQLFETTRNILTPWLIDELQYLKSQDFKSLLE